MTDQPTDNAMTPEEAGIWPEGFVAEGGPPPLTGAELAAALAGVDLDAPADLGTESDAGADG